MSNEFVYSFHFAHNSDNEHCSGLFNGDSDRISTVPDPNTQYLKWNRHPHRILVIRKIRDKAVIPSFVQLVTWLINEEKRVVYVEQKDMRDLGHLGEDTAWQTVQPHLLLFQSTQSQESVDFVICLGGDGTLIHVSSLFQQSVPPVMAFHHGSLGFLAPFSFDQFQEKVSQVFQGNAPLTLRSRLRCVIESSQTVLDSPSLAAPSSTQLFAYLILNEVVIDRGPSPYLCYLDLFIDEQKITTVQGDGLIISTPTGSTAYSCAAGAGMLHPSVPAILLTPICPHSLSFRPIVVPAGVLLKVRLSEDSRSTAWISFDGRYRQELKHGFSLRVTTSIYPVPSICLRNQVSDWFSSLNTCLQWNRRKCQKQFDAEFITSDLAEI